MRISNKMFYKNIHMSLQRNLSVMAELQTQISSGAKIHRPSDDPVTLGQLLDLNRNKTRTDKYLNSISTQMERLGRAETALTQATDLLQRAKDIAIDGSGNLSKSSAEAFAQEVDTIIDGMIAAASRVQGTVKFESLFERDNSGAVEVVKYTGNPVDYSGHVDPSKIFDVELLNDTLNPEEIFIPGGGEEGIFDTLIKLRDAFNEVAVNGVSSATSAAIAGTVGKFDEHFDMLLAKRTGIGAKINRLETLHVQLEDQGYSLNKSLANLQGVDIAEAIVQLSETELTYHAALSATSRILQTGLMDYLE